MRMLLTAMLCVTALTLFAQQPVLDDLFGGDGGGVDVSEGIGATPPAGANNTQRPGNAETPPVNPFEAAAEAMEGGRMGMGMDMGMEMDMDGMDEGYGMMDGGGGGPEEMMMGGMGGMMGGGMMGEYIPDPEQVFQRGLQRAIRSLRNAENDEQKTALKGYIKTALEQRYTRMIDMRRKELDRLKAQISKLEQDLKRREAAKKRVVEVQMQSVELASEGLLELGDLQRNR